MAGSAVNSVRSGIRAEVTESLESPAPAPVERSNLAPGKYSFQYRDTDAFITVLEAIKGKEVFQMHTTGGFGDTRGLSFADPCGNILLTIEFSVFTNEARGEQYMRGGAEPTTHILNAAIIEPPVRVSTRDQRRF